MKMSSDSAMIKSIIKGILFENVAVPLKSIFICSCIVVAQLFN